MNEWLHQSIYNIFIIKLLFFITCWSLKTLIVHFFLLPSLLLIVQVLDMDISNQWSSSTDWECKAQGVNWQTFCFHTFLLFNNVWSFVLSLSDKPQGIFVIRIGTVDQKSIKWKRQSKNIDKHMSVYVCEWIREEKL
jgi:hypothetical protein